MDASYKKLTQELLALSCSKITASFHPARGESMLFACQDNSGYYTAWKVANMSVPQLVGLWNCNSDNQLTHFSTKEKGAKKVWKQLLSLVDSGKVVHVESLDQFKDMTHEELDKHGKKLLKEKSTMAAAKKKTTKKKVTKKKVTKKTTASKVRGRAPTYDPKSKIKILSDGNPKRKGSASYERFALYKNGMTVGKFLEKGGRTADLKWDVSKGFISVT